MVCLWVEMFIWVDFKLTARQATTSYTTFLRCYSDKWSRTLRFRHQSQHSKCNTCEKLKEWRRHASSPEDAGLVCQAYAKHIREMQIDDVVRTCYCWRCSSGVIGKYSLDANQRNRPFQVQGPPEHEPVQGVRDPAAPYHAHVRTRSATGSVTWTRRRMRVLLAPEDLLPAGRQGRQHVSHLRIHHDNTPAEGKNQAIITLCMDGNLLLAQ